MENNNLYKEERFDSFINRTIILSSKRYFKKQMNIIKKEKNIIDDVNYTSFLQDFIVLNNAFFSVDEVFFILMVFNSS